MRAERVGGSGELRRVGVLAQPGGVEELGEVGGFLGGRGGDAGGGGGGRRVVVVFVVVGVGVGVGILLIRRNSNHIKIQRLEKLPLLVRRHERVLHQLVKRLETLHVNADGVLVALLGLVKRILLRIAQAPQIAHARFVADIARALPVPLLAPVYPFGSWRGHP